MALALQPAANLFRFFEVKGDSIVEITPRFNFMNQLYIDRVMVFTQRIRKQ